MFAADFHVVTADFHVVTADFLPTTCSGHPEPSPDRTSGSGAAAGKQHEPHLYIIFIHPLQNGLFRVQLRDSHAHTDKSVLAPPAAALLLLVNAHSQRRL